MKKPVTFHGVEIAEILTKDNREMPKGLTGNVVSSKTQGSAGVEKRNG